MNLQLSNVWTGGCITTSCTHIVQQYSEACQTKASRSDVEVESWEENKIANSTNGTSVESECWEAFNSNFFIDFFSLNLFLASQFGLREERASKHYKGKHPNRCQTFSTEMRLKWVILAGLFWTDSKSEASCTIRGTEWCGKRCCPGRSTRSRYKRRRQWPGLRVCIWRQIGRAQYRVDKLWGGCARFAEPKSPEIDVQWPVALNKQGIVGVSKAIARTGIQWFVYIPIGTASIGNEHTESRTRPQDHRTSKTNGHFE